MRSADSHPSPSRRVILACLALALVLGIAALFRGRRDGIGNDRSGASAVATTKASTRPLEVKAADPVRASEAGSEQLPAPVAAVLPGHERHGDECAQCLAERKLFVYREDYAQLHFKRIRDEFELDPAGSGEMLDACRRFARTVLTEWSFSDSKPRLAEDAVVESRRREILDPLLGGLSRKPEDDL